MSQRAAPDAFAPAPWRLLLLLWLMGGCLRVTVLAVPPVIAQIQHELHMSATEVGLLNSLPVLMFALSALPGALLVARLGLRRTLILGLGTVAFGAACRGLNGGVVWLFASSIVMGAGIAVLQPALPAAVRQWVPKQIGFGTAVYTNGLLVSEVVPVVLAGLLILPMLGGSWRASLVFWACPVAIVSLLVSQIAPRTTGGALPESTAPAEWWPNWRDGLIWRLAVLFCGINSLYFGTNAFLPGFLDATGKPGAIVPALAALNFAQIPASLLLLMAARHLERRAWPYVLAAALALFGFAGVVFGDAQLAILGAALIGFAGGGALILALSLPALLAPAPAVVRTSAAVFTLSYGGAVVVAVLAGVIWDLSQRAALAFVPLALSAIAIGAAALVLRAKRSLI